MIDMPTEQPSAMASSTAEDTFMISDALGLVLRGAIKRGTRLLSKPATRILALQHIIQQLPGVHSAYVDLDGKSSNPNYNTFIAEPLSDQSPNDTEKVEADINNFISSSIYYRLWVDRAQQIRSSGQRDYCVGNLSVALNVGAAYSAGMAGANTILSLIPTASVLIGAPAKELWVLFKLCPLAGILSILLSLGGNIVPMEVNDYENIDKFQYQGMMPSAHDHVDDSGDAGEGKTEAELFANQVLQRARSHTGGRPISSIVLGMLFQCCAIAAILVACWFLESGAILVWWCESGYWMFVWYLGVAFSSILENFAGVPFTKTYTIRAWRAPPVVVDDQSPWVRPPGDHSENTHEMDDLQIQTEAYHIPLSPIHPPLQRRMTASERQHATFDDPVNVLMNIEKGYSSDAMIWMDHSRPYSQGYDAFYILLSVKGISTPHAFLRVFSKVISIGAFAVGTALFASATLITIMEALVTASLILCAGIFGRVTAMWMASTMMRHKPVLHRVVNNREEAGKYLQAIFKLDDVACEINGHVIVQGRCVKRLSRTWRWSRLFGVLSKPYSLSKMAVNHQSHQVQERQSLLKDSYAVNV
ncbi:hypothetical protein GQ53DRAFT_341669 [Thozetella sp. PMI_491]|nr:hypothetical protein GQ53DRAFT_341669 [Thozetella sp. PMI_491]